MHVSCVKFEITITIIEYLYFMLFTDVKPKRPSSAKDPMQRVRSTKKPVTQKAFFYTDEKNKAANVGRAFVKIYLLNF